MLIHVPGVQTVVGKWLSYSQSKAITHMTTSLWTSRPTVTENVLLHTWEVTIKYLVFKFVCFYFNVVNSAGTSPNLQFLIIDHRRVNAIPVILRNDSRRRDMIEHGTSSLQCVTSLFLTYRLSKLKSWKLQYSTKMNRQSSFCSFKQKVNFYTDTAIFWCYVDCDHSYEGWIERLNLMWTTSYGFCISVE